MGYFHRTVTINGYEFGFEIYNRGSNDGAIHIGFTQLWTKRKDFQEALDIAARLSIDTLAHYLTAAEYSDPLFDDEFDAGIQASLVYDLLTNPHLQLTHGEHRTLTKIYITLLENAEVTKPNAKGFVYLIQSPTEYYKIGRTRNPDDRLKTFGVKLPFEVAYIALIPTRDMYRLEKNLHSYFARKRVGGEWFKLFPQDVDFIKGLVVES